MAAKKIGLILPGAIWFAPFVRNYTRILDTMDVDYSIISWSRDGEDKPEGFQYKEKPKGGNGSATIKEYRGYVNFVKETVHREKYDKLIVFCSQSVCLLADLLLFHYRGKFMIDYRDLSIEQRFGYKQLYSFMLKRSALNVISSPGFKRCLPNLNYIISHNFDETAVRHVLSSENNEHDFNIKNGIEVLTIGGIRDYSSNVQVIDGLANKENVTLRFIGRGASAAKLEEYSRNNDVKNVTFKGYYEKQEEPNIVKSSSFLNIFYPRIITHDTALSNRFYNSLLYKRPMIVTKNTTQGEYAEKYGIGIAVDNCNNLVQEMQHFLTCNYDDYAKRCDNLLRDFLKEQEIFVSSVRKFILS